jgi:hypothetical protein
MRIQSLVLSAALLIAGLSLSACGLGQSNEHYLAVGAGEAAGRADEIAGANGFTVAQRCEASFARAHLSSADHDTYISWCENGWRDEARK